MNPRAKNALSALFVLPTAIVLAGCGDDTPVGLAPAAASTTRVRMDLFHRPLPDLPLPNDLATRYDASSATGRRVNASMVAPTQFESHVRAKIDQLDGWGVYMSIAVPFDGRPLDVSTILAGHRDADYDPQNDVIYLINVDRKSARFGELRPLDLGNGNYPVVLQVRDNYWKNDPRVDTMSLLFEETDEDLNKNGRLDPGEDTDADGVLDAPNYLPGKKPAKDDLAARADALMTFYERETNTLLLRPVTPLEERTTYAVVITRRLKDIAGEPVGSPYPFINHASQTSALGALPEVLPAGLKLTDVAFAFTFTTQTVDADMVAVRDGLYGLGAQAHLATAYPAEIDTVEQLRDTQMFPTSRYRHLMYGEDWLKAIPTILQMLLKQDPKSAAYQKAIASYANVDYFVVGSIRSPQLFPRFADDGSIIPYNDQSWPPDLDRVAAPDRSETLYFTLAVPRPEVSVRREGKPAPIIIVGHGYGGSRFDGMQFAGFLAAHGFATLSIDCPSHGLPLDMVSKQLATALLGQYGLTSAGKAIFKDRAFDQNNDGKVDSGADFWSAYLFHTRDMVRQAALDYMQLIRVFSSFDGQRRWSFDLDANGQPEIAGDFDGDGVVDAGGATDYYMMGGSLGGIMSMMMGSVEPKLTGIAPISGGGGLADIGMRSKQGGVPEAFILRAMGPLFAGTLKDGKLRIEQIVPDLNDAATIAVADVTGIQRGDTMLVVNTRSGEQGCGYVDAEGRVRAEVAADTRDPIRIELYRGWQQVDTHCRILDGSRQIVATVEKWQIEGRYQGNEINVGEPLQALSEGLGLHRARPDFRRFQALGQLIIDLGDPANYARHLQTEPLVFGTGEKTGTHAVVVTTMGDMNVPASSGLNFARAAGLIEYRKADPRYGKPVNQELIDDHTFEAAYNLGRYTDPNSAKVHLDVENFSQGGDMWGRLIPRKEQPYHLGFDGTDPLGGKSVSIVPYTVPEGQHGFALPGEMTDSGRAYCHATCGVGDPNDPCDCAHKDYFDIGLFMFRMLGRWLTSGAKFIDTDLCQSGDNCAGKQFQWASPPPARDAADLK